eukprot:3183703-Rhodomonas_salina.1
MAYEDEDEVDSDEDGRTEQVRPPHSRERYTEQCYASAMHRSAFVPIRNCKEKKPSTARAVLPVAYGGFAVLPEL